MRRRLIAAAGYAASLPAADAAGLARPGLNPRIGRLRVERIAVPPRELRASRAARFFRALMRDVGFWLSRGSARGIGSRAPGLGAFGDASIRTGANCVAGPSGFGESTALERSRPRNSPGRYSSATDMPLHATSVAQRMAAKTLFGPMRRPPEILETGTYPSFRKPKRVIPAVLPGKVTAPGSAAGTIRGLPDRRTDRHVEAHRGLLHVRRKRRKRLGAAHHRQRLGIERRDGPTIPQARPTIPGRCD